MLAFHARAPPCPCTRPRAGHDRPYAVAEEVMEEEAGAEDGGEVEVEMEVEQPVSVENHSVGRES